MRTKYYACAADFLRTDPHSTLGCVVLDFRMPGMNGLELLRELTNRHVRIPVIFLTAHGDVPLAVKAMQRGAVDFLTKPVDPDALLLSVGRAVRMEPFLRTGIGSKEAFHSRVNEMTDREREVLRLLAQTKNVSSRMIAERLGLSERTVENYRLSIYRRLGIHREQELRDLLESAGFGEEDEAVQ